MSSQKCFKYVSVIEVIGLIILSMLSIILGYPLIQLFPTLNDGLGLAPAISGIMLGTFLVVFIYTTMTKRSFLLLVLAGLISSSLLILWSTELLVSNLYTPFKDLRSVLIWHTLPFCTGLIFGFVVRMIFNKLVTPKH